MPHHKCHKENAQGTFANTRWKGDAQKVNLADKKANRDCEITKQIKKSALSFDKTLFGVLVI